MLKNINWKVRLKNPTFWAQIVVAIISPILVGLDAQWQDDDLGGAMGCPA